MNRPEIFVLTNPNAGRGRGAHRIAHFRELLRRHLPGFEEVATTRPGEEAAIVDQALAEGYRIIVACGGDGTWSLVADRIVRSPRRGVGLALLPAGTGCDFGKSSGITWERSEEVVRAIAAGHTRRIDVGRAGGRYFLNVVGLGFDIAVIDDSFRVPLLRGDALYRFCAIRQLFRFPGLTLEISEGNGSPPVRADHLMLVAANGRYFGGSFDIAPEADLTDGVIDLVSIHNADPLTRMRLFRRVARGQHAGEKHVQIRRGRRFSIGFEPPLRYEMDGEVYECSKSPLTVESVPAALDLVVP